MKLPENLKPSNLLKKDKKGVALVTVLTVMALTTILVLTFFSLATSEHRASNTYSHGLQAQQVAEQAVNMVIAQIREATTVGTTKAWASQPGAIRQWDQSGGADFAYKLYSDDTMKTLDWSEFQADFLAAGGWSNRTSHYVDLNEPVIRGDKVYYPIVHPAASTVPEWPKPLGEDNNGIEGFSYNQGTMQLADEGKTGELAANIAKAEGHVAMPVMWIYQLADGTLGVLNGTGSGSGSSEAYSFRSIAGQGTPSETNPMVARFAFWADDETSKLNVNTHAGGLAWDTPKTGGELDMSMGKYQPAQKEWQRYPGHPASTHLGPALAPGVIDIVNDRDAMEMLYRLVPRIVGGGSESGTRVIDTRRKEEQNGLIADREPLFPTLDDVIMRSDREPHEFPDAQGQAIKEEELSDYLERSKFFVTANSRAPETNMFNLPRVAIWPIYNADLDDKAKYNKYLTPFDQLIHYCASMGESAGGGYPRWEYIFKRENADSTTHDYENIPQNKALYGYLLDLLERPIPGYGDSFASKYAGGGHKQILTEIFDYIRTTNLHDDTLYHEDFAKAFTYPNSTSHLTYTNSRNDLNKAVGLKGHGQVVPIKIDNTKGFGRFYTVSAVQIQVISCAEPDDRPLPLHFGATSYRNRKDIAISNASTYQNFPPIPKNFDENRTSPEHEPAWLKNLRENNPALYQEALKEENWNWQLAYLDQKYFTNVVGDHKGDRSNNDPALHKFNRLALTPSGPGSPFTDGLTRLNNDEQLMQGVFFFNLFTPSIGWNSINPDMEIEIEIADSSQFRFQLPASSRLAPTDTLYGGKIPFIGFDMTPERRWTFATNQVDSAWGGRRYGGTMPFEYLLAVPDTFSVNLFRQINKALPSNEIITRGYSDKQIAHSRDVSGGRSRLTWTDRGYDLIPKVLDDMKVSGDTKKIAQSYRYDLVTVPFKVTGAVKSPQGEIQPAPLEFKGGEVTFSFYHGGESSEGSAPQGGVANHGVNGGELIQEVTIEVPDFESKPEFRRPLVYDRNLSAQFRSQYAGYFNEFDELEKDTFSFLERNNLGADPSNFIIKQGNSPKITTTQGKTKDPFATGRFAQISVHGRPSPFGVLDIVQSVELAHGDARIAAGRSKVEGGEVFKEHRYWGQRALAHSQTNATGGGYYGAAIEKDYLIIPTLPGNNPYNGKAPLPFGVAKSDQVQLYGDFDNGAGLMIDGPYINKPDEGNTHSLRTKFVKTITDAWDQRRNYGEFPYFNREDLHEAGGPAYFSPNRLVSGPGMFGSLPTGVLEDEPWRTLLFRPELEAGSTAGTKRHPGGANPPDHLIMDLFWMPVVEPYAISEPLSTAGKVNMNYQIVPFLHVDRSTALRGVFRSEFIMCVPNRWHTDYKHNFGRGTGYHWRDAPYSGVLQGKRLRAAIREDDTLEQFKKRFDDGSEIFKSSTAICEMHLVPEEVSSRQGSGNKGSVGSFTPKVEEMDSGKYWQDHALVGDNSRERPYANIQARLTTKSNTFLVHYRAQVIKQARRENSGGYAEWRPGTDSVQAEYRGSSLVERYVNPDADDIPNFAGGTPDALDMYYRYRVVNPRRFSP